MTPVAGHPPTTGRPRLAARDGSRRGDDLGRRVDDRRELSAGGALGGARLLRQVGRAHLPAAMAAGGAMPGAGVLAANEALLRALERVRLAVHVAFPTVLRTPVRAARVEQGPQVRV